jgi:hypothetical protein
MLWARSRILPALALLALGLAGCGGSATKTVTVETPAVAATKSTTTATTPTATGPTTATQTAPSTTSTTSSTRSAPEPSFTEQETHVEGAAAAAAVLRAHGYTANDISEYHPEQTLRVLVGTRSGSDASGMQAFFFLDGRYLGTDTKEPSGKLRVVSQSDTEVAIAYPLYRPGNSLCCPAGGERIVHFALNNGKLTALDPIPPANSTTGLSRN